MAAWVSSGDVIWVILAGMVLEAVLLGALHRRSGRGIAPGLLLPNLVAGGCLIAASGAALRGVWWGWVSALLLGGLASHLVDLRLRWR